MAGNIVKKLFLTIFLFFLVSNLYSYEEVSLKHLFDNSEKYNGKKVIVTGEVIGEPASSGKNFWVNITNGEFFIGVFLEKKDIIKIKRFGRYLVTGDTVRVVGVYNEYCLEHFGDNDIHAETLEIVKEGEIFEEEIDIKTLIMVFILGVLIIFFRFYSRRNNPPKDTSDEHL